MKQTTILALSVLLFCLASAAAEQDQKPNILFIAIDDLNDWNGLLKGNPQAQTPHMEALAAKGMVFTNAHCAAPACGPSRAAIMSGIRPSTSGNYVNKSSLIHNPTLNNSVLLPEFFQQNGYYVCGGGKLFHGYHFNHEVKGRGFDEYFPSKTQDLPSFAGLKFASKLPMNGWARQADWGPCLPGVTVDDHPDGITANWASNKLLGGELQEPFFLGAGIFQPHLPNYAPQEYFDRFPLEEIKLPEGFREDDLTVFGYRNYGLRSERYRYITYEDGTDELYDHKNDRWEWKNLAGNPEYAEVIKELRQQLPTHHEPNGVTYVPPKLNWDLSKPKSKK